MATDWFGELQIAYTFGLGKQGDAPILPAEVQILHRAGSSRPPSLYRPGDPKSGIYTSLRTVRDGLAVARLDACTDPLRRGSKWDVVSVKRKVRDGCEPRPCTSSPIRRFLTLTMFRSIEIAGRNVEDGEPLAGF